MRLLSYFCRMSSLLLLAGLVEFSEAALAHTANKVWYENHDIFIRILVSYTIPEIRELREASIDFPYTERKKATKFYWDLVRGADFFLYSPDRIRFVEPVGRPDPW